MWKPRGQRLPQAPSFPICGWCLPLKCFFHTRTKAIFLTTLAGSDPGTPPSEPSVILKYLQFLNMHCRLMPPRSHLTSAAPAPSGAAPKDGQTATHPAALSGGPTLRRWGLSGNHPSPILITALPHLRPLKRTCVSLGHFLIVITLFIKFLINDIIYTILTNRQRYVKNNNTTVFS